LLGRGFHVCDIRKKCYEFSAFASVCETVFYNLCDVVGKAVPNFVSLYLHGVNLGEIEITFFLIGSETVTTK
jgi:hypothetical protein